MKRKIKIFGSPAIPSRKQNLEYLKNRSSKLGARAASVNILPEDYLEGLVSDFYSESQVFVAEQARNLLESGLEDARFFIDTIVAGVISSYRGAPIKIGAKEYIPEVGKYKRKKTNPFVIQSIDGSKNLVCEEWIVVEERKGHPIIIDDSTSFLKDLERFFSIEQSYTPEQADILNNLLGLYEASPIKKGSEEAVHRLFESFRAAIQNRIVDSNTVCDHGSNRPNQSTLSTRSMFALNATTLETIDEDTETKNDADSSSVFLRTM